MVSCGESVLCKNLYEYGSLYCYGKYSGILKKRFSDYKFRGEIWLGRYFGELMYNRFYDAISEKCYELITYVPVSDNRFKERGYDQSREMAIALAKKLNIACVPLLINVSGNAKQSRLNRKGRFSGIKGRFELNDSFRGSINCKIIIIDDILTTGATLNECAGILMKNGAVSVDAMVFASGRSDLN